MMPANLESRTDHRVFEADELSVRLQNLVSLTLFYVPSYDSMNSYVRINATVLGRDNKTKETKIIFDEEHNKNINALKRYNELRGKILNGKYRLEDLREKLSISFSK